jgi:hypothetical protein
MDYLDPMDPEYAVKDAKRTLAKEEPLARRSAADCSLELADYLSHAIFAAGNEPFDRVQRIQFMGGKYPDHETKLGGYCREALRDCIKRAIDARPRFLPENYQSTSWTPTNSSKKTDT